MSNSEKSEQIFMISLQISNINDNLFLNITNDESILMELSQT